MQIVSKIGRIVYSKFIPPKPILGRWGTKDNSYIKTDLANHDSCGDRLCGDPQLTRIYILENLVKERK